MEIKTEINRSLHDSGSIIASGTITIVDDKIVQFNQNKEQLRQQSLLDIQGIKIIKSNKANYSIEFINKYDIYQNKYNAKITIINGSSFYVKLNLFKKQKIKWMLDKYWIQKRNNITVVIIIFISAISAIIAYLNYIK